MTLRNMYYEEAEQLVVETGITVNFEIVEKAPRGKAAFAEYFSDNNKIVVYFNVHKRSFARTDAFKKLGARETARRILMHEFVHAALELVTFQDPNHNLHFKYMAFYLFGEEFERLPKSEKIVIRKMKYTRWEEYFSEFMEYQRE